MSIDLVFTSYCRPDYLAETLYSWSKVRGIQSIKKTLFLEPSNVEDQMLATVERSGLEIEVVRNPVKQGVLTNPWKALNWSFDRGSEFTVLGEEDLVVSSDILEYFEWARLAYSPEEALGVCSYTAGPAGQDERSTFLHEFFEVWVWGTWRYSWFEHIKDTWDHDYSTGLPNGTQAGWDWNLSRLSASVKPFVHVASSRSKHIGEHGGTHMTPGMFASMPCPSYTLERSTVDFHRDDD